MNVQAIEEELNRLYQYEIDKYVNECNIFKKAGFRIYRNSKGIHKVVPPAKKTKEPFNKVDFNEAFGGIFGDIFGG